MAYKGPRTQQKSPAELAAEKSRSEAERALEAEKDPEAPGWIPPENLTVVLGVETPENPIRGAWERVELLDLLSMDRNAVLALGLDRGYWRSTGRLSLLPERELRAKFFEAQAQDGRLHSPSRVGGGEEGLAFSETRPEEPSAPVQEAQGGPSDD